MTMKTEQHKYVTEKFSNLGKILLGMEGGGAEHSYESYGERQRERDRALLRKRQ